MFSTETPAFHVGSIPVYGRAILSPMAGFSDVPYRAICRTYGSAMHYTEFVPVEALQGKPRSNRFWQRLDQQPSEHPMVFQIFGNNAQKILDAALNIRQLDPDIIDINMGCSTRKVSGRGAGVGMMKSPDLVAETFRLLTQHLDIPITGKIRLGWDENKNFLEIGRILEDNGAALVAIHGRTKQQKYSGQADWEAIAALKQALSIPVIGNGDIDSPELAQKMLDETGCDAVMIGRGAIGNPWIFSGRHQSSLSIEELFTGIQQHTVEMIDYYGEHHGLILFRKHLKRYLQTYQIDRDAITQLVSTDHPDTFFELLEKTKHQLSVVRQAPPARSQPNKTAHV